MSEHLGQHGYAIVPHAVGASTVATVLADLGRLGSGGHRPDPPATGPGGDDRGGVNSTDTVGDATAGFAPPGSPTIAGARPAAAVRARKAALYAVRDLMTLSGAVRDLAWSGPVRALVEPQLGSGARPVRAILFDKTAGANWKVAWHQDLSIAVRERRPATGFGPWSVKAGVPHVQPPAGLLARMLTVRLHLDDCGPENGPLLVLPGSHRAGVLAPVDVARWRREVPPTACLVPAGGAVLMRPLLLHASSAAAALGHRRVVHLEWSADALPAGLQWHEGGPAAETGAVPGGRARDPDVVQQESSCHCR